MDLLFQNPLIALFVIIGAGLALGNLRVKGVSLGSSGVIFSALFFGAMGATIPAGVEQLGLVLFVYSIGIAAGPGFFRAFASQGVVLAKLGVFLTASGALVTILLAALMGIPKDLAVGIFAGAMTSTPALASAMDAVGGAGAVSVGYGIAYPFGGIGVVLFIQLLPRLLKIDLEEEANRHQAKQAQIQRVLVEVKNSMLFDKCFSEIEYFEHSRCRVSRVLEGEHLHPVSPETVLKQGMNLMVVGEDDRIDTMIAFIGQKSDRTFFIDAESRARIVVTSSEVVGKDLRGLNLLNRFGLVVSRVARNGVEFVPNAETSILQADTLVVVGANENIRKFEVFAGHRMKALDETDLLSIAVGIAAGLVLGMIPFGLPNSSGFALGLSGGPLMAGLILGHFGKIGKIRGHIPQAARLMMMEMGLVLFLAGAGIGAGGKIVSVFQQHGPSLLVMSFFVMLIPMAGGYFIARKVFKLEFLQTLGGICGGMTSTPGLGVLSAKVDSEVPSVSYAAAYPVALILMTIFSQIIVQALSRFGL